MIRRLLISDCEDTHHWWIDAYSEIWKPRWFLGCCVSLCEQDKVGDRGRWAICICALINLIPCEAANLGICPPFRSHLL